jgi:hypothetical protein
MHTLLVVQVQTTRILIVKYPVQFPPRPSMPSYAAADCSDGETSVLIGAWGAAGQGALPSRTGAPWRAPSTPTLPLQPHNRVRTAAVGVAPPPARS